MSKSEPIAAALDSCALRALAQALRAERPAQPAAPAPDRLVTAAEAAAVLGVSKRWLYSHGTHLPFARHLSRRALRFSEAGLQGAREPRWSPSRARPGLPSSRPGSIRWGEKRPDPFSTYPVMRLEGNL